MRGYVDIPSASASSSVSTGYDWCPNGLSVIVRDGIVHLTGIITDERSRQAAIVGAAVTWLFAACVLQIRVGHLTKPAEHMLAI